MLKCSLHAMLFADIWEGACCGVWLMFGKVHARVCCGVWLSWYSSSGYASSRCYTVSWDLHVCNSASLGCLTSGTWAKVSSNDLRDDIHMHVVVPVSGGYECWCVVTCRSNSNCIKIVAATDPCNLSNSSPSQASLVSVQWPVLVVN